MRTLYAALAAALVAGVAVGAIVTTHGGNPAPQPVTQADTIVQVSSDPSADVFTASLREGHPEVWAAIKDRPLLNLGRSVCGALDRGATFPTTVSVAMHNGYTPDQAGYLIGASISALCPEHTADIPG